MTKEDIDRISEIFAAAGRTHIPVPISQWKEESMARIGAASVKTKAGKTTVKPVETGLSVSRRIGRDAKAKRAVAAWTTATTAAYKAGEKAGLNEKPIGSNPHDGRTREGKDWVAGYRAGQKVARKSKRA